MDEVERKIMESKYVVEKSVSETWTIRLANSDYGIFRINETLGDFSFTSSYMNGGYIWRSIGDKTLKEFVSGLDFSYFMGKIVGQRNYFDANGTFDGLKKSVIEYRKCLSLEKIQARILWNVFEKWEKMDITNSEEYYSECSSRFEEFVSEEGAIVAEYYNIIKNGCYCLPQYDFDRIYECFDCDMLYPKTDFSPSVYAFWDKLWPVFKDVLKKEIGMHKSCLVKGEEKYLKNQKD